MDFRRVVTQKIMYTGAPTRLVCPEPQCSFTHIARARKVLESADGRDPPVRVGLAAMREGLERQNGGSQRGAAAVPHSPHGIHACATLGRPLFHAPFHIRPVPRTPAPCSLHHVTYTYNPQPSSAAHAAWSADAAVTQPILRVRVIGVCCSHRVQLKTAIHAMYGYVDGIKIDVADCKECVCAAAPRCAAQCTAIGLSRCCGVQLRLAAARARRTSAHGWRAQRPVRSRVAASHTHLCRHADAA